MSKTIFLLDDSQVMLSSLRQMLELSGFKVETAGNGQQGLDRIKTGFKPDLIITDINMPKMNGIELIKQVKALPGFRFTPILTLTTEGSSDRRDEAKKLGATGWLIKPVSGPDLVKVIKQLLPGA
jgi:two-component system chemotaxis response regulator CheY